MTDSTQWLSDRVENYVRFRPSYLDEVIGVLMREAGLSTEVISHRARCRGNVPLIESAGRGRHEVVGAQIPQSAL